GGSGSVRAPDIVGKTLIPLDTPIARPHFTRSAIYRITLKGDGEPATALIQDGHQEIRNPQAETFILHVQPPRPGRKGEQSEPGGEYLASCYYINSSDERIQELAQRVAGSEKDPWKKAQRLERWVKQTMQVDNTAPMVPAGAVARSPRGDCRHYALL